MRAHEPRSPHDPQSRGGRAHPTAVAPRRRPQADLPGHLRRARRWLSALSLALAGAACGDDGTYRCNGGGGELSLGGSYCEDVRLDFTEVRIRQQLSGGRTYLSIKYLFVESPGGPAIETLSILLDAGFVPAEGERRVQLQEAAGVVRRTQEGAILDLTSELTEMSSIRFGALSAELGSEVAGELALHFRSGRALSGKFRGLLEEARPGP